MKLYWTGTDSLMLINYSMRRFRKRVYWWLFRRFIRVAEFFIQGHIVISSNITGNLRQFRVRKPIEYLSAQCDTIKYKKVEQKGFTVLYYLPAAGDKQFNEWLYGYDIFKKVKINYPGYAYIIVNGSSDMSKIYPYIDFYIRCNRHDGPSRMILECDVQGIPYYHSQKDPNYFEIIRLMNDTASNTASNKI